MHRCARYSYTMSHSSNALELVFLATLNPFHASLLLRVYSFDSSFYNDGTHAVRGLGVPPRPYTVDDHSTVQREMCVCVITRFYDQTNRRCMSNHLACVCVFVLCLLLFFFFVQVGINRALFGLVAVRAFIIGDACDDADDVVGDSGGMY